MKIKFFPNSEISELENQLFKVEKSNKIKGILILACDNNNYNTPAIDQILKKIKKPIFGGIFPSIIYAGKKHETGFILVGFESDIQISAINDLNNPKQIEKDILIVSQKFNNTKTIFTFIDGFSTHVNKFIQSIFSTLGLEYNYIGGGAGSLSLKQKPCILTNNGIKQDCAIIAGVDLNSGIGVKHGWQSIAGPLRVTSANNTIIKELNFQPAFTVYKTIINNYTKVNINESNFFEIAKAYPFGINKMNAEKVVRAPIAIGETDSLVCVGEVETGSFVDILSGNKEELIKASGEALKQAVDCIIDMPENFIFFIDCISRVLFLQEDFHKELEEVNNNNLNLPLIGALTIGEIANNGKEYLEFYNKTSVVGCF